MEEEQSSGSGDVAATTNDANNIPVCSKTKEEGNEENSCEALRSFQTYGWMPDPSLSNDDNLLDLLLIVTRSSTCREGGMGCIITRPNNGQDEETTGSITTDQAETNNEIISVDNPPSLFRSILAVATNRPLYSQNESDIHAEVCALGYCARQGSATEGCTAYITMPPCKKCLGALVVAGIGRIVFPRKIPSYLQQIADDTTNNINLTLVNVNDADEWDKRRKRVEDVIAKYHQGHLDPGTMMTNVQAEISLRRKQRKEEKQQRKQRRIEKDNNTTGK